MPTLPELLRKVVELEGSDLHITTQTPPQIRVHGHLQRVDGPEMTPSDEIVMLLSSGGMVIGLPPSSSSALPCAFTTCRSAFSTKLPSRV